MEPYPKFDLAKYFGVASTADIPWGHAINSRQLLAESLQADIMLGTFLLSLRCAASSSTPLLPLTYCSLMCLPGFAEADICVADSDPNRIIMSHPPVRESDITLFEWIDLVLDHCSKHPSQKVGMKLDFKDPPAVAPALAHLADLYRKGALNIPLWVNADILDASGRKPPFNPETFLSTVQTLLPGLVLSVGWTTLPTLPYTMAQIEEMLAICKQHDLKYTTFPMRACLCRASEAPLRALLEADPTYTLTVWAGHEKMTPEDYEWVKQSFDNSRIYMDVKGF